MNMQDPVQWGSVGEEDARSGKGADDLMVSLMNSGLPIPTATAKKNVGHAPFYGSGSVV